MAMARLKELGPGQQALTATAPLNALSASDLDDMLQLALRGGRTVVSSVTSKAGVNSQGLRLAHPLARLGEAIGAIAVELERADLEQQKSVTKLLKWGNAWLELLLNQQLSGNVNDYGLMDMLQLVLRAKHFQEAAMATIGVMAHHYGAERTSLGVYRSDRVQPIALSDSTSFSPRSTLAWQLGQAMDEAMEQSGPVNWHENSEAPMPAHSTLAEQQTDGAIFSVVLRGIDGDFGVITLEKKAGENFDTTEQAAIVHAAQLIGPILELKQAQEQSLIRRTRTRIRRRYADFVAHHRFGALLGVTAGLAFLSFVLLSNSTYRVGGPAELQGAVQQAMIAPFDSYVAAAHVRAGERVKAGFVLAELDDRELRLELRQLEGDLNELSKQYRKSLAALDHAEARILKAQMAQAEARIDLLQQHLSRTRLVAPFAAIVVSGDLSRSLGKPVERGEVLFELAPLAAYRVVVEVADRDIAAITPGQQGALVLAASPTERLPIEVINVTSATGDSAEPGTFRVEARLINAPTTLRPGMRGITKIEVGQRRRIWIWTHELVDWLYYQLWAWLP